MVSIYIANPYYPFRWIVSGTPALIVFVYREPVLRKSRGFSRCLQFCNIVFPCRALYSGRCMGSSPFSGKATFHKFDRLSPYYCSLDLYKPFLKLLFQFRTSPSGGTMPNHFLKTQWEIHFWTFYMIETFHKKKLNRNMDILISNLLLESISDYKKWSTLGSFS